MKFLLLVLFIQVISSQADWISDFAAIDAVVDATHRYHEIFYTKGEQ